jgi:hypothetical protein
MNLYFSKNTEERLEWKITKTQSFDNSTINWTELASKIHEKMGCERNDFSSYSTFIYGWGLILRFKNKEDEAHFMLLASSGVFDQ